MNDRESSMGTGRQSRKLQRHFSPGIVDPYKVIPKYCTLAR